MQLQELIAGGLLIVLLGFVLSMGATVLTDLRGTQTADTYAYNATTEALKGVDEIASWQDTIALVIVFAVIISLLVGFVFRGAMGKGSGI